MSILDIIFIVTGLVVFEVVSSIDNAVINAEVLSTMSQRARRWFLVWGFLIAVFAVRGLLPWLIIWASAPSLGLWGSLTATFSNDPSVHEIIERSAPVLMAGGGTFLVLLFFHWLFLEEKNFGLPGERFFVNKGLWFYAVASVILVVLVWFGINTNDFVAFGTVVGSSAFFITHGFKQQAERAEASLKSSVKSDFSKILYLEIIDATFSIDGVLGAFAFTLSVPLILIGNGIGAFVLRTLTIRNIDSIRKYLYLKNGAMYSIAGLGGAMLVHAFGGHIPVWFTPVLTIVVVGFFFIKSKRQMQAAIHV